MAASDARFAPLKNTAFRYTLPIYDNTGALVSGAAGLDSEVSIDGAAFADCTNEATEIGSSGIYYIDLTAGEMNGDTIVLQVKTTTTDAKTSVAIFTPILTSTAMFGVNLVSAAANTLTASALAADAGVEIAAAVWDRVITGANHNITNSAGKRLREITNSVVHSGTAQAGSTNTITLASTASSTNGTYDPALIRISGGTGAGQARLIIDYTGSTRVAVVDRDWRTAPDNTSEYEILASPNLMSTNEGLAQGGGASTITLNANASSTNDTYVGQTVVIRTGTGQDQSRLITAYNGSTKVATVAQAWATQPTSSSAYMILAVGRAFVSGFVDGTITAASIASDAVAEIQSGLATAASIGDLPTAVENADALLNRNLEQGGNGDHTVEESLSFLRNKWSLSGTTLTVYEKDGTTPLWTGTVSTNASADPVTGNTPS
jgi:hypothetical protein